MASSYAFKILAHSPDRQRVVVWLTRNNRTDKYMVVAGTKSLVWTRTRGRSYIITADKCNCPASRGRCKHVLVTAELKGLGFFPPEEWLKFKDVTVNPVEEGRVGVVVRRHSKDARNLERHEHFGQGWFARSGCTIAVLRDGLPVPQGWCRTTVPEEVEFGRRCFIEEGK